MQHVLEQECLIGDQQRIAMHEVDLELADAHFMHEGIARDTQRCHGDLDLIEERP